MMNIYVFTFLFGFVIAVVVMTKLHAVMATLGKKDVGIQHTGTTCTPTIQCDETLLKQQEAELLQHLLQEEQRKSTLLNDDLVSTENDFMELQRTLREKEEELEQTKALLKDTTTTTHPGEMAHLQKALTVCENLLADADLRTHREVDEAVQKAVKGLTATHLHEMSQLSERADAERKAAEREAIQAELRNATLQKRLTSLEQTRDIVLPSATSTPCSSNPTTPRLAFTATPAKFEERGEIVLDAERKLAELKAKMLAQRSRRM